MSKSPNPYHDSGADAAHEIEFLELTDAEGNKINLKDQKVDPDWAEWLNEPTQAQSGNDDEEIGNAIMQRIAEQEGLQNE